MQRGEAGWRAARPRPVSRGVPARCSAAVRRICRTSLSSASVWAGTGLARSKIPADLRGLLRETSSARARTRRSADAVARSAAAALDAAFAGGALTPPAPPRSAPRTGRFRRGAPGSRAGRERSARTVRGIGVEVTLTSTEVSAAASVPFSSTLRKAISSPSWISPIGRHTRSEWSTGVRGKVQYTHPCVHPRMG